MSAGPAPAPASRSDDAGADPTGGWTGQGYVRLAVVLTLLPLLYRAVAYALIGSHAPAAVAAGAAIVLVGGRAQGGVWERRAIRLWATGVVLWAAARLALQALVETTDPPGVGAQLRADLSPTFTLVSLAYLAAGIALWRWAGEVVREV